jgi:hypothetical protein
MGSASEIDDALIVANFPIPIEFVSDLEKVLRSATVHAWFPAFDLFRCLADITTDFGIVSVSDASEFATIDCTKKLCEFSDHNCHTPLGRLRREALDSPSRKRGGWRRAGRPDGRRHLRHRAVISSPIAVSASSPDSAGRLALRDAGAPEVHQSPAPLLRGHPDCPIAEQMMEPLRQSAGSRWSRGCAWTSSRTRRCARY